jgi:hypothetical protein
MVGILFAMWRNGTDYSPRYNQRIQQS